MYVVKQVLVFVDGSSVVPLRSWWLSAAVISQGDTAYPDTVRGGGAVRRIK